MTVGVVLAAAGSGKRVAADGDATPKQWRLLAGVPLLVHAFRFLDALEATTEMVVALDPESLEMPERLAFLHSAHGKRVEVVGGAGSRQESVWHALRHVGTDVELALVHDAARPFPPPLAVGRAIQGALAVGGAILAVRVSETIKRVGPEGLIAETPDRTTLWAAQTPQVFGRAELLRAYRAANAGGSLARFTDDASIFEAAGGKVRIVEGSRDNIKVTEPEDFARAERILAARR